jgi:hypothetical protein
MSTCAISAENHPNYSNPGAIKGGSKASQASNHHGPNPALTLNPSRSSFSGVLNLGPNYGGHRSNYKNYIANQIANHAGNQMITDSPNPALNGGHNPMKSNHGIHANAINPTANSSSKWDDAERWINNPSPNSRSLVEPNNHHHVVSNCIANPKPNHVSQGPIKKANPTNQPQSIRASCKNAALLPMPMMMIRKANQAIIIGEESVANHAVVDQPYPTMPKIIHGVSANGS